MILESLEQVEFASIIKDRGSSMMAELVIDGGTLEMEIVAEGKPFSILPHVSMKPGEAYYGLRLIERTIEAFKIKSVDLTMRQSTQDAIAVWENFRETNPKVDGNLIPIIFPSCTLRNCLKLGLVYKRESNIFFL